MVFAGVLFAYIHGAGLLFLAAPIALIVSGFPGYRFAGRALDPLREMVRQTEQITANRLHDRIPVENPDDEFGQMAKGRSPIWRLTVPVPLFRPPASGPCPGRTAACSICDFL